jgi:hypothetical protein
MEHYEVEIWSIWFKSMFEDKVVRSIFGPREEEVTGGLRKLCNEDIHELYSSPGQY